LFFSTEFNITSSSNWANLKPENGLDGNPTGIILSEESKQRMSKYAKQKHVVYVCRLTDQKVLDWANYCKWLTLLH